MSEQNNTDEGIFSRNYNLQEPPRKPEDNEKNLWAFVGVLLSIIVTCLWVALFCGVEIEMGFILIPAITALSYSSFAFYFKLSKKIGIIHYVFAVVYLLNIIVSLVGWFSIDTNISATAIISIILAPVFYRFIMKNQ